MSISHFNEEDKDNTFTHRPSECPINPIEETLQAHFDPAGLLSERREAVLSETLRGERLFPAGARPVFPEEGQADSAEECGNQNDKQQDERS